MKFYILLLCFVSLALAQDSFPDDFDFGVGSAAYQIEGGWNADGKGENIWDFLLHKNKDFVSDGSNGDTACDGYRKFESDIELINNTGVDFYRFSISWSRIFPTGHTYDPNEDGIIYYNDTINMLTELGIRPIVTIYHWDLPQPLLEIGGWPNSLMADYFADYADKLFSLFGDRVKDWITFNEPYQICEEGFSEGILAPGYRQMGIGGYLCGHTLLLAHAKAYKVYNDNHRATQKGKVGITVNGVWAEPLSDSAADTEAATTYMMMTFGWFVHPIFSKTGDYPEVMRQNIDRQSTQQRFKRTRLPEFTAEEVALIRNSADFLGLNHYGSVHCRKIVNLDDYETPSHSGDMNVECYPNEEWEETAAPWYTVNPVGLRRILNWIKDNYENPEVIITENGYASNDNDLRDCGRVNYMNDYLEQLLLAITEDECKVTGYTAWSIMDLFEWNYGYEYGFGLYHVDFTNPSRPRTARMSSYVYKNIIETRKIDPSFELDGFETCAACSLSTTSALILAFLFMFVYLY